MSVFLLPGLVPGFFIYTITSLKHTTMPKNVSKAFKEAQKLQRPSAAYKRLKALGANGKRFKAPLTIPLAEELLSRAEGCRPVHPGRVSEIAWAMLNKTFDIETDSIVVFNDTDTLKRGIHRLSAFLESGLKEMDFYWQFGPSHFGQLLDDIGLTPANVQYLEGLANPTANKYYGKKKPKNYVKQMERNGWASPSPITTIQTTDSPDRFLQLYEIAKGAKPTKERMNQLEKSQRRFRAIDRDIARKLISAIGLSISLKPTKVTRVGVIYWLIADLLNDKLITAATVAEYSRYTLAELLEILFID